ncbi:GSCFA domain-containing protein [Flavobacterium pallidum]|uniref:GSCFA domain-containing protein n=1 Tax=Flavobacterium pallidum TaxID=2172098 RepID=A0A2S1SDW8_9FLAO|nr:GSCFA domain-containing protein [Flavobacterium pallidum]AWI24573.1 GSCFA domain-containing protein [Flavobacterium pallidum]
MQFRTEIPIAESSHKLDYKSSIVSLGSCFAESMAEKFGYYQFRNTVNPFGIIFQPLALAKIIRFAAVQKKFTEADVFHSNDTWHCFDAHSALSNVYRDDLIDSLNASTAQLYRGLENATHLIVTLGTAWVYKHDQTNEYVANCHKVPQRYFSKQLLSVDAIADSLKQLINSVYAINPDCHIIFTVSPVRHIKDGFVENQQSKANLISALHNTLASSDAAYFPSYEIMMDELRDYRFYAEDMLHPNQTAVDYIWQRFVDTHIKESAYAVMNKVGSIQKSLAHRPFNPDTSQHLAFQEKLQEQVAKLQSRFPHMVFSQESQ